jgi:hypothetical protein
MIGFPAMRTGWAPMARLGFVSTHEGHVTVRLINDERLRLERMDLDRLNGF